MKSRHSVPDTDLQSGWNNNMVKGLIGIKRGMTQFFQEDGTVVPVTLLEVGPCVVTQVKTVENDGYSAVQLGLIRKGKTKGINKPEKGHFDKAGVPTAKILKEFDLAGSANEIKTGDRFTVDIFKDVKKVDISGVSKGKGFQGVVRRWGFAGGRASHGSMFHRAPGSIGSSSDPSRVFKGLKLPGHMGSENKTSKRLMIVDIDETKNLISVKGAVPGSKNSYVFVKVSE